MLRKGKIKKFQEKIFAWYKKNKRSLPWRKTKDPYHILVSEIMLQQTQVDRVIPHYHKFIQTFPDLETLANAPKHLLLRNWVGLGYNSRALRLQQLAQHLAKEGRKIPETEEELLKLPGIGPYTSAAILAFAFNKPAAVIDTNIRRVLISELNLSKSAPHKELQSIAAQCIPEKKSRIWHNALMDYGALYATARRTRIQSLSKQSKFKGSARWVRGYIIKEILKTGKINLNNLKKELEEYAPETINTIVLKMEKEKIILRKKSTIRLHL